MIEEKLIPQCEIVLETLEDVFRVFQPSHEYWASYHTHAWVFRGHAIENWQLVPTIFRNDVRERFGLVSPYGIRLKPFVLSEIELLRDFTLFCDSVGLQIPEQAYSYIMNVNKFNANDDENSFNEFPPVELQHLLAYGAQINTSVFLR